MSIFLELKKIHRTGLLLGILAGGLLAAAVPILNIAARPETFLSMQGSPLAILISQNWSMLGMLNLFYLIIGDSILYHIEYADGAMEKMKALEAEFSKTREIIEEKTSFGGTITHYVKKK